ncbi:ImmA/IrrE family metallo-endopeptidase [Burkholderia sp. SCN-KJ]|uniref:ImmA/IrrE family metallo-endopeptidase n=1 Tax=Burkholderia sp. SCN-KJ TaxID=2969248 RepID=UPI0021505CA7|nr:ImmA/IrrE family metallo-endopeptidase [Burkholderia sp. SCN-KJ]MCR4470401.1 ImmA/IrrE family metallo-endopeptidase [Burkholderia sp. SCN-KJ]
MTRSVTLDLMELDGKASPEALADEIFRQNPGMPSPVPLEELSQLAGIESISELESDGFAGMLVANAEKSRGAIFVRAGTDPRRRRFTVGHELGHFLLPWHKQERFECRPADISISSAVAAKSGKIPDIEIEANAFAAELLMPRHDFKKMMNANGEPELEHVVDLSSRFDVSVEATIWRYKALSDYPVAFVFAHNNVVRYWTKGPDFPFSLCVRKGYPLPRRRSTTARSLEWENVPAYLWLEEKKRPPLPETILEQTLQQLDGYSVTLLFVDELPEEEDE